MCSRLATAGLDSQPTRVCSREPGLKKPVSSIFSPQGRMMKLKPSTHSTRNVSGDPAGKRIPDLGLLYTLQSSGASGPWMTSDIVYL